MSKDIRIGYVNQIFPALTETFVYREVFGLQREGIHVSTFAIWKLDKDKQSEEAKHLVDSTHYAFPMNWSRMVRNHLYFLLRHPAKYLGTFFFVLTRPGESFKNRLRTFYHFCEAVYLATDVKGERVQHMHAHFSINAATVALVLARLLDISFSFTTHNNLFYDQLILKEKIRDAKFIIVVSEYNRRFIAKLMPGEDHNHKIHTVHYGLSVEDFSPPATRSKNEVPLIFMVSQLAERKGIPYLVKACHILSERGINFQCILAGDGPQRPIIEQLIEQYKLHDKVKLVGALFQEQLKDYLNQADIFALPCIVASNGDIDGIPNVLMEAMALEIPVVSTYVSGIPELIENDHYGLLVDEKDEVALAKALQRLLEDEALRSRLGKNGRRKVIDEFNIKHNAAKLAEIFERYVKPGRDLAESTAQQDLVKQWS
jgi:colanic acid/amylovoran biosynthesis glycosyltransferase